MDFDPQAPPTAHAPAPRWRKTLMVAAEVLLVLIILGLLAANWVPILIGARQFRGAP